MKNYSFCIIVLAGSLLIGCDSQEKVTDSLKGEDLFRTVEKYVSLGEHRTGTPADTATSYWLAQELESYGYETKYLEFPLRQFFPEKVFLSNEKDTVKAFPLWWVGENVDSIVHGSLVDIRNAKKINTTDIALIHLPVKGKTNRYIDSLITLGVKGIVAITDNPSGEIEAYNTALGQQPWKVPVILVAPKDSSAIFSFSKRKTLSTLSIQGTFKDVKGRNVYGTIGHGSKYIVISTPISGWFTCGGERGTGLALWLGLAKWVADEKLDYTFVFTGNSGHEQGSFGAHKYLEQSAPAVDKTHLWIHFGAGAATLAYSADSSGLTKQTVVDANRRIFYNEAVRQSFEKTFKDVAAQKILIADSPAGELLYVAKKGYPRFAGVSYGHPFFHVITDDASTTSPEILEATAIAWKNFIVEEAK